MIVSANQLAGVAVGAVIVAALYVFVYAKAGKKAALWWSASFLAAAAWSLGGFWPSSGVLFDLFLLVHALLLLAGLGYLSRPRQAADWIGAFGFAWLWQWVALTAGLPFPLVSLPLFGLVATGYACSAVFIAKLQVHERMVARVIASAFVLLGLASATYPFIRDIPGVAPWALSLAPLIGVAAFSGLVLLLVREEQLIADESATFFKWLLDQSPDLIFRARLGQPPRIDYVNDTSSEALGYSPQELAASPHLLRQALAQNGGERCSAALAGRGPPARRGELALSHRDGSTRWAEHHTRAFPSPDGGFILTGVLRDITSRKLLERDRREQEAQRRYEAKMVAVSRLALRVGSEMQNAAARLVELSDGRPLENAVGIELRRLATQLLVLGSETASDVEAVDAGALLEQVCASFSASQGDELDLALDIDAERARARVARDDLEQLIINLLQNAREAMPEGGRVTVTLRRVEAPSACGLLRASATAREYLAIEVADTGVGMSPKMIEQIFEPFYTTHEERGALGLGLSTVFGIVRRTGGSIQVESQPDAGTVVSVVLPQAEPEHSELEAGSDRAAHVARAAEPTLSQTPLSSHGTLSW